MISNQNICIVFLRERPRINSSTVDFEYLKSLPESSLGGAYVKFLQDNVSYFQWLYSPFLLMLLKRFIFV